MNNADMPAMPTPIEHGATAHNTEPTYGLTKREIFAMHAMQGLLSSDDSSISFYKSDSDAKHIAQSAVAYADALLAELDK